MINKTIIGLFILISNLCLTQTQGSFFTYITIPDITLLDIEPISEDVVFEFEGPIEPGDKLIEPDKNDNKWINYTATVPQGGPYKNVTAQISLSTFIPGLKIDLTVSEQIGQGQIGTPIGLIELSTTAQIVVSGIGGSYTNDGIAVGHRLKYEVYISDYSQFEVPSVSYSEIIFTMGI